MVVTEGQGGRLTKRGQSSDNAASFEGGSAPAGKDGGRKREEKVRRPWRGLGWGYIVQLRDSEQQRKWRYPQHSRSYTVNRNVLPTDGRR